MTSLALVGWGILHNELFNNMKLFIIYFIPQFSKYIHEFFFIHIFKISVYTGWDMTLALLFHVKTNSVSIEDFLRILFHNLILIHRDV